MEVETVRPDLLVAVGERYQANSTIFLDGDRALLVDGMGSTADARELRHFVEKELGKSVRFLVSTHFFSDHLAAWKEFPGVPLAAHRNYRQTFESEAFRSDEEAAFFVEPTVLIGDELEIRWGRYTLEVFYNPGHTLSTLAIDVPEADLLLVGDTLVGNLVYLCYGTASLLERALTRLRSRRRKSVLSSHGGPSGASRIDCALYYLKTLEAEVAAARREGRGPAGIQAIPIERCLAPGLAATGFERGFHLRNLDGIAAGKILA